LNTASAVTPDNFLFFSVQLGDDVREALAKVPADKPVRIEGRDGVWYPTVKSQPIPNHYTWESKADDIAYAVFSLANFAHGNACIFCRFHVLIVNSSSLARQTTATTLDTPKNIQPPEALTGNNIDLKSDIWALGCTVSLILIPTLLFLEATLIDDA
jgi:serine/threonine protein kinase